MAKRDIVSIAPKERKSHDSSMSKSGFTGSDNRDIGRGEKTWTPGTKGEVPSGLPENRRK